MFDLNSFLASGRTLVIAEVGSNHGGDHKLALESVAAAKEAGADVVKFQLFKPETLVDDKFPVLKYIQGPQRTQRERFGITALPERLVRDLAEEASRQGIVFMATPFDLEAVDILAPLQPCFKIASGDLTNHPLIDAVVAKGMPVMISTGLSDEDEIDAAAARIPADLFFPMHCVAVYPTPDDQVNLATIPWLGKRFGRPVGFSDHSGGGVACVAAVALGARIVEKHFLPRDDMAVADKALSIGIADFRRMVDDIRRVESMRGSEGRRLASGEEYFRTALRRSLYARVDIPMGTAITADRIVALRPWRPEAVPPSAAESLLGRLTCRPIAANEAILFSDLVQD
ncbi:MAG: N-acetylneuraminate synthase family protein [Magnetospirillum sp. WYHS-4]